VAVVEVQIVPQALVGWPQRLEFPLTLTPARLAVVYLAALELAMLPPMSALVVVVEATTVLAVMVGIPKLSPVARVALLLSQAVNQPTRP
jgi:hypothetical protein